MKDKIAHVVWSNSSPQYLACFCYLCEYKYPEKELEKSTIALKTDTSREGRVIREKIKRLSNLNCLNFFLVVFMHLNIICINKNKLKRMN